jgi:hypothetical protein
MTALLMSGGKMSEFDPGAFTGELERMGLRLTTTQLADGKYRVNRWRMINAISPGLIERLWAANIGDDQGRIAILIEHLSRRTPEPQILAGNATASASA